MTWIALLRLRFKLTIHARKERLLLAEEAALIALHDDGTIVASGDTAKTLLDTPAASDLAPTARDRFIQRAQENLPDLVAGPRIS